MGMHMSGRSIFAVPSEHLPGLIVLALFPAAVCLVIGALRAASRAGFGPAVALERRLSTLTAPERFVLLAALVGAAVHAAIVPTHWGDSRVLAVLFIVDTVGLLAVAVVMAAGWRHWRAAAGLMLGGTVVGYVFYLVMGWETPDLVGLSVTSIELAGALVLAMGGPVGAVRGRWVPVAAVPVSVLALLGSAVLADQVSATTTAAAPSSTTGAAAGPVQAAPSTAGTSRSHPGGARRPTAMPGMGTGTGGAPISLTTTSPAGPITWPLPSMTMKAGMQMATPDCTSAPTAPQQRAAVTLVNATVAGITKYRSLTAARAAGYVPITRSGAAVVHYIDPAALRSGRTLDPGAVQSLVYANTPHGAVLVAGMYLLPRSASGGRPPTPGGCLDQWHIHTNLCFSEATSQVAGTTVGGACPPGQVNQVTQPMMHVWLAPVPGGPLTVDASGAQILEAAGRLPAPQPENGVA